MKFSKQALLKLKNKNRKFKPDKYKKLKRDSVRRKHQYIHPHGINQTNISSPCNC